MIKDGLPMALYTLFFSSGWSENACSISGTLVGVAAGLGAALEGACAAAAAAADGRDDMAVNCDIESRLCRGDVGMFLLLCIRPG